MPPEHDVLRQLFQQEFAKMVAVLSRRFGLPHIELAEDVVSETFLLATETWQHRGPPDQPAAWLYAVARQKTLQLLRRDKIRQRLLPALTAAADGVTEDDALDFSPAHIRDSQLQMLFALCTPAIASEAQIGLALRILCGFGIEEIAEAFLVSKDTINKRLFRAKEKLRAEKVKLELPSAPAVASRLDNVLRITYLLFSEGYYSKTQNEPLRRELCREALRLGLLLTAYPATNQPKTHALLALMCFHISRFDARQANGPGLVLYEQQDETLWNADLINQGNYFLALSAQGPELSTYHLEARIAGWHCVKTDTPEKWEEILQLYNQLLLINYSPSVALSRTFAFYKANGQPAALAEALKLRLHDNPYYFVLLGELYRETDAAQARASLQQAQALVKTAAERESIHQKLNLLSM